MGPGIRPAWPGARLCAPAFTVRCLPGDNLAIHVGLVRAPRRSVLVVTVGGEHDFGYWGEVLTTAAESRGLVGLVIEGGVRDVAALETHGFPVFSTKVALKGTTKEKGGESGGPIEVGGVMVHSGDWIVADSDGVAVIPAARVQDVVVASRARAEKESQMFAALRAGRTTLELLDLEETKVAGRGSK